jgi:nitrogen-specific signal transduction histidine kinase
MLSLLARSGPVYGYRLKDHDGNEGDVVVDVAAIDSGTGSPPIKLIHIRDFSDLRNYQRWRDDLISMVAHEIKNPLTAIRNSLSLLIPEAPPAESAPEQKFLATSLRGMDRLIRLLDTFLDVSRIAHGAYKLERTSVQLREFLSEVLSSFTTLFNVRRIDVCYEVSEKLDELYIDPSKLEQVLINLLSNAIKFTPDGGRISIIAEPAGLDAVSDELRILPWNEMQVPRFVKLIVKDTGIGMSDDTLAHLFTRYYEEDHSPGVKGSHLGLSISKSLIEVQNGNLKIESRLGLGTRVSLSLPADRQTASTISALVTINQALKTALNFRQGATFHVLVKENSRSWENLTEAWCVAPLVNSKTTENTDREFFLWTLTDRLAVTITVGDIEARSMEELYGSSIAVDKHCLHHIDGYVVGRCRAPMEGRRLPQLFHLALRRVKHSSPVKVGS